MSTQWMYIRDTITVDANFKAEVLDEIADKSLPADSTLYFAARVFKHAPGYTFQLKGYNVTIMAEDFDTNGGAIDLSGPAGASGAPGANGAKGIAGAGTKTPGGNGTAGGSGGSGTIGNKLFVLCKRVHNAALISTGGAGGNGGRGGSGGPGGSGKIVVVDPEGGKFTEIIGTKGGNGARGGNGGAGGSGGSVTIFFAETPTSATPSLNVSGGAAGLVGSGGAAGPGGPDSPDGNPGTPGTTGVQGSNGHSKAAKFTYEGAVWNTTVEGMAPGLNPLINAWAEYRVRMGQYFFRSFSPKQPSTANNLSLAGNEFRFALTIAPEASPEASVLLDYLGGNMNPLGMSRSFYLVPDFPRYEQAFTVYAPLVRSMISDAKDLLLNASQIGTNKTMLANRIQEMQGQLVVIESEKAEGALAQQQAQSSVDALDTRMADLNTEIEAKRAEITAARLELGTDFFITVAEAIGAVIAVVGAVYTGGASLMALPGLLVAAQETWGHLKIDQATGKVTNSGDAYMVDWVNWTDKDGKLDPKLKPEIEKLAGGLKDVIKAGKEGVTATLDLIDKAKVLADIGDAKIDGSLEGDLKNLLKRSAELAFERAQAKVGVEQAKLRMKTIELRAVQAQAAMQSLQQLHDSLGSDLVLLGRVSNLLVKRAQDYMTHLSRFQFWATRALEIYALKDYSGAISYDMGFIHPDLEENAYLPLRRQTASMVDSSRVLGLMEAYLTSWAPLPGLIARRDEYLSYTGALVSQSQPWTYVDNPEPTGPVLFSVRAVAGETPPIIPDPTPPFPAPTVLAESLISQFRKRNSVDFEIKLNEILPQRFECKLDRVSIALVGATAQDESINCLLVHKGESQAKRLDGTIVRLAYPPLALPIAASKVDLGLSNVPPGEPEGFWGRSPASKWRLSIEPAVMSGSQVNLAGLTKIVLGMTFKCFVTASLQPGASEEPEEVLAQVTLA